MSLEGQHLGEFEILERLGQGGMGAVYKARQTSLDRMVALKTLQASLADDVEFIGRFRREAKAAAGLNHPNLVQVHAAGETGGLHWFAMEYVEGESAQARLQRKGRLDPLEAIAIAIHVATALEYGWRKAGLIHRDIKPDNIFLSEDGEVKLGDLGLAKSAGQAQGLTVTGASMGTPYYISPEQAQALKTVDFRADIYSLGCTLYHLLCGQPPYTGDSPVAIMMKHVSAPVSNLRGVWPECPPELAAAVMKMMLKPPEARPQSYEEVLAELRWVYDLFSGTSVPNVVAVTQQATGSGDFQSPSRLPSAPPGKSKALLYAGIGIGVLALAAGAYFLFSPKEEKLTKAQIYAREHAGEKAEGGTRSAAPQTSASAGAVGTDQGGPASLGPATTPTPPANGQALAVAAIPQPEATPVPATPAATPQPSAPATPAAPTPVPSTPVASTPTPSTPKPATEVEKWFAQVDGPQQEAFQKQVLKPFEAGVADLRVRYLASLDAAIERASTAGQLKEALAWRTERQAFEKAQNVVADDDTTPAGVKALRATCRQQLARLEEDRTTKAKALLAPYDAILAKYQTLLTQRKRLDDALLLQTRRDAIALAWLGTAPPATIVAAGQPEATTVVAPGQPEPAKSGTALLATKDAPFVNTLGMKFVPVPIVGGPTDRQRVLFSVWDTRMQDYEVFAQETGRDWPNVGFEQGPTHPAVSVTWEDAQAFCAWLTERERKAGKLGANEVYRLPSDHEWSCAVGLGAREVATKLPADKSGKITNAFPWGTQWPPPKGAGNYAGEELRPVQAKFNIKEVIAGYNDGFVTTSPVGSFAANRFGLCDMGGNVWQWCEDWFDASHKDRVTRGSSWVYSDRYSSLSSFRHFPPSDRVMDTGFRCVVGVSAR